jgi:multiple sugar transport system ATP-binding protein
MVMVRLNHVTTRYNPLHYHPHPEFSRFASEQPQAFQGPARPDGAKVLDDLSLTILPGETLSVVGPSGCGKSTLLRVVAGLIEPATGEVYFDGRLMNGQPPRARQIGMVFQNYALYPHMAAQENVGFFWRLRRKPKPEISAKVRQTAQVLDIGFEALLGRLPRHLSGGEQQRVAVGRCIIREPSAFLLDEPFSNLDAHLRERSRRELKKLLMAFGVTTMFVTHDQHEAIAMGDRIAVMRDGKIVQVGPFREMYEDPHDSFVAGFLGDPPISLLARRYDADTHSLHRDGEVDVFLGQAVTRMEHGQEVLLGVRAEHVSLTSQAESEAMRGRVSHVEPRIGDRSKIVYLEIASQIVAAKVPYETPLTIGEAVVVRFDPGRLLLFDAQTHRRVHLVLPS